MVNMLVLGHWVRYGFTFARPRVGGVISQQKRQRARSAKRRPTTAFASTSQ